MIGALSAYFNKSFVIPDFKTVALTTAELDKYVGKYSSSQMPLKVAIPKNNTVLFAQATGQSAFPLEAKGEDKFVFGSITLQFDQAKNSFSLNQGVCLM